MPVTTIIERPTNRELLELIEKLTKRVTTLEAEGPFAETRFRGWREAAQNLANNVFTKVTIDKVSFDPSGRLSEGAYKVPSDGIYAVFGEIAATAKNPGVFIASIFVGNPPVNHTTGVRIEPPANPTEYAVMVASLVKAKAGDLIALEGFQNSGAVAPLNVGAAGLGNTLAVIRVA